MDRVKNRLLFGNMLVMFMVLVSLWTGRGLAAPGDAPTLAPVSTSFSYEGRLATASGRYDFKFRLFDAPTGGSLVSVNVPAVSNVLVDSGEYFVNLNFGTSIFTGDARYLEVQYRPSTSDPNVAYKLQTARPQLLAVPYAMSLRPGAIVEGPLADSKAAITGETSSPGAYGLKGDSTQAAGVFGASRDGSGVFGSSFYDSGVYGQTYAENTSTVAGVYGKALRNGGIGVIGEARLGNGWGVSGIATSGTGVRGEATSGIGVAGTSASGSAGVYGRASGATASGVEGNANGRNAAGVYGKNLSGRGVWGYSESGTAGVYGESKGGGASGVEGYANNGPSSAGVYGRSTNGVAVWGRNEAGGIAMKAEGNAVQSMDKFGWPKAMIRMRGHGELVLCYNGVTGTSTAETCGFSLTAAGQNVSTWYLYNVDFGAGFDIQRRFISLTGSGHILISRYIDANTLQIAVTSNSPNAEYYIITY